LEKTFLSTLRVTVDFEYCQSIKEDSFIQSNNNYLIGIICLAIYGIVLTVILILKSWKNFKRQNFSKSKIIIVQLFFRKCFKGQVFLTIKI